MKAIRHYGFGGPIQIDDVEPPSPTAREVVVRVKRCQIGGDVLKVLAGTGPVRDAENYVFPHTGGYRGAGVVEAVGSDVGGLAVGDRVVINGFVNCNTCEMCRRGLDNLCPNSRMIGIDSGAPGALAELTAAPEWAVFKLPDSVSFARATLLPNMALLVHAYERALPRPGFTTAVIGCGLVGSCAIAVARAYGASRVVGVDTQVAALEMATRCGATDLVDANARDAGNAILDLTDGVGVDVAVELVGVDTTIQQAIASTTRRGITLLIGALGAVSLSFPHYYRDIIQSEVDLRTCFGKTQADFAVAVKLAGAGLLDLSAQSLKEHPFHAFETALEEARSPDNSDIHIISMESV